MESRGPEATSSSVEMIREVVVIVLSILIAFALDAGWEAQQDRSREREILNDLASEAASNLEELEIVTERQKARVYRIEALLKDLQEQHDLTYLFISHDLSVVEHISDSVGVMYLGSLVESGPKKAIFQNPLHPYTQALLSAAPVPDPEANRERIILEGSIPSTANPPSGCKFHTRCWECMDICKTEVPKVKEVEPGHMVQCHLYD